MASNRSMFPDDWCLKIDFAANLQETLKLADELGFPAIMTTVVNPEYKREFIDKELASNQLCFTRSPMVLEAADWTYRVIPYICPPNIGVNDEELREQNERQFLQELSFAFHLKQEKYISIKLTDQDPVALGEALLKGTSRMFNGKILVEIPLVRSAAFFCDDEDAQEPEDQWRIWNKFHAATEYSNKVEVALVLTSDLPSEEELKRWLGEPVGMLIIPHSTFFTNKSNYPILSRKHQTTIAWFVQYCRCQIAIEPRGDLNAQLIRSYREYVKHVITTLVNADECEMYNDGLRYPLQPLHDNLDTTTYEVFEMDPAKYILYQRAIEAFLKDKISEEERATKKLVLMILGAGRGPLIRCTLNACKNTGRKLKILVVEKNPNAIVTLTCLIQTMWPQEDITLISKDMRKLELKEKADVIVSELLGSFGDNELSPECLDGAQHLLKPDGVSIPNKSISYLRPVMHAKLVNTISEEQNVRNNTATIVHQPHRRLSEEIKFHKPTEVNWLVKLSNVYYIAEPKELFTFVHPNHDDPIDNSRYGKLEFKANIDCVLTGFSGYFSANLYNDIEISILPATHTQGMASWYPIYFPVERTYITKDETITAEFWRKEDEVKVWYEWKTQDGSVSNQDGIIHPILK